MTGNEYTRLGGCGPLPEWSSRAKAQPGRKTTIDGLNVEFCTRSRYMTVTGNTYRAGGLIEQLSL